MAYVSNVARDVHLFKVSAGALGSGTLGTGVAMDIHFDGYIPEDDYACITIEAGDTATAIAFTNDERDAVVDAPLGWRCPVCSRGLAPHVSECSCIRLPSHRVSFGGPHEIGLVDPPPEA